MPIASIKFGMGFWLKSPLVPVMSMPESRKTRYSVISAKIIPRMRNLTKRGEGIFLIMGFSFGAINQTNTKMENIRRVNCPSIDAMIGKRASIMRIVAIIVFFKFIIIK